MKRAVAVLPIACLIGLGVLATLSFTAVPAGSVGIVSLFGAVSDTPLDPGLNLVNPLATVTHMTVQTQIVTMAENVPTKEGLDVHLEAAALIRLDRTHAVEMFKTVGVSYLDKVVVPQFRSVIRTITSKHDAKDLYSAVTRTTMSTGLHKGMEDKLKSRGLIVEDTPLKKLELPQRLHDSIEDKLSAEQEALQMEFVLQKQEQETRRMKIEATGVAQYQEIVAKGIDENLLRWKGIEATKQLAASANTKIVVIGGGKDGLPIILNTADGGTSKTVAAAASHTTPALRGRRQSTRRAVTALTNLEN